MTIYVDDARIHARVGRFEAKWSHLFADTQDELHKFAQSIGLKRAWFQGPPKHDPFWHYDVTESKRREAVKAGAVEVSFWDAPTIMLARDGACDCPSDDGSCPHCGKQGNINHRHRCHQAAIGGGL